MTDAETRVQDALRRWGREPTSVASVEVAEVRAARARATLTHAIREGARRRRARRNVRALGAAGALAAALLLGWLAFDARSDESSIRLVSGTALVVGTAGPKPGASELAAGDRIEAARGGARLELGSMTEVALNERAVLAVEEVEESAQRLVLSHGQASFEVDPERRGRVTVDTPDAHISVVGTYFHVNAERGPTGTRTSVRVERGLVEVRAEEHSVLLHPGESWSSRGELAPAASGDASPAVVGTGSASALPAATREPATALESLGSKESSSQALSSAAGVEKRASRAWVAPAPAPRGQGSLVPGSGGTTPPSVGAGVEQQARVEQVATTLAEEINLYRSALSARNAGDDVRAVERLETFAAKYPRSTLRQEATVEYFRALRRLGRTADAARAATRYLSAYPAGFARAEASELALPGH
jgi:ferric-dicitrate binding protein FerR (iron transport regulator)